MLSVFWLAHRTNLLKGFAMCTTNLQHTRSNVIIHLESYFWWTEELKPSILSPGSSPASFVCLQCGVAVGCVHLPAAVEKNYATRAVRLNQNKSRWLDGLTMS